MVLEALNLNIRTISSTCIQLINWRKFVRTNEKTNRNIKI